LECRKIFIIIIDNLFLLLCLIGHDSKPSSSENLRLHPPSRTKESLNVPIAESSCFVSIGNVTPVEHHSSAVSSSSGDRQVQSLRAAHCAVMESTPDGALLRPTLTSSRKGHGHRHRRAMRRASSGVSCGMPLSLVEVDPREPQVVLSESALLSTRCSSCSHRPAEALAMQTTNSSHATVGSPAHSDLSSLSSYKETSPESEAAGPPSSVQLKLNASCPFKINLTEARRRSDNRLSSLSHSRDSLEMYKNRTQRKLSVDGTVLSESAIVHAVVEPASLASNSGNADCPDHVIQTDIASTGLQSSDNECSATVNDQILTENEASNISIDELSLSSAVPEASAMTSCDDMTDQACGGNSPTEYRSESSNTLTPATDISMNTVRKRTGKNGKSKSATSSSKKLTSLFCGASTSSEVGDGVHDPAVEANRTNSAALDWLFSTDSEGSPSSGMHIHCIT